MATDDATGVRSFPKLGLAKPLKKLTQTLLREHAKVQSAPNPNRFGIVGST